MGEKSDSKLKDLGTGGGLAIVACTKELGDYHIVARNPQTPIWVGFYARWHIKR
jgi:hypothetical protein